MANLNLSEFTEKLFVADADHTFIWDTAASISKRVSRNSWLNSGTLTSDAPVTISQTWNNAAVAFTGLKFNAAGTSDANSAVASKLLEFQIGGVSKFSVDKYGITTSFGAFRQTSTGAGINVSANGSSLALLSNNAEVAYLNGLTFALHASASFGWASGAASSGSFDTILLRDGAANTLALRNGGAPQTFNVYGTWTTAITNFERLAIKYNTTDVAYQIAAEKGTTNGDYRPIELWTGGSKRVTIPVAGGMSLTDGTSLFIGATSPSPQPAGSVTAFHSGSRFLNASKATTPNGLKWLLYADSPTPTNGHGIAVTLGGMQYFGGGDCDHIWTTDNNGTERMRIKHTTGNVGIGTTAPSEKLHVLGGKVLFGDPSDPTGTTGNGELTLQARAFPQLNLVSNLGGTGFCGLNIKVGASDKAGFIVNTGSGEVRMGGLGTGGYFSTFYANAVEAMRILSGGNVGIGTTSPTSKLHVAGSSSPSITVDNTLATGASQLLFKNTVVTGDTDGIFLNGSAQSGFGGAGSLNIKATTGPIAFHTASVTNALSIAQSGAATFAGNVFLGGFIQLSNADGRISFDGGNKVFSTAANTYIQDLYRRAGSGDPNGTVTAPVGATYNRTDGGANTSFYVKESGTGNTGWVNK